MEKKGRRGGNEEGGNGRWRDSAPGSAYFSSLSFPRGNLFFVHNKTINGKIGVLGIDDFVCVCVFPVRKLMILKMQGRENRVVDTFHFKNFFVFRMCRYLSLSISLFLSLVNILPPFKHQKAVRMVRSASFGVETSHRTTSLSLFVSLSVCLSLSHTRTHFPLEKQLYSTISKLRCSYRSLLTVYRIFILEVSLSFAVPHGTSMVWIPKNDNVDYCAADIR